MTFHFRNFKFRRHPLRLAHAHHRWPAPAQRQHLISRPRSLLFWSATISLSLPRLFPFITLCSVCLCACVCDWSVHHLLDSFAPFDDLIHLECTSLRGYHLLLRMRSFFSSPRDHPCVEPFLRLLSSG